MIEIDIPNYRRLKIEHVVFDVNGTLAVDGKLLGGVAPLLQELQKQVEVHLVTADTHGQQAEIDQQLGLKAAIISGGAADKSNYIRQRKLQNVAAIGNGANDTMMFGVSQLRIAVIGGEGAYPKLVADADVVVVDVRDALNLLLQPNRLRATLRR